MKRVLVWGALWLSGTHCCCENALKKAGKLYNKGGVKEPDVHGLCANSGSLRLSFVRMRVRKGEGGYMA